MKQKLLQNFRLRAVMFVALMCAAVTGAWADKIVFADLNLENGVQYSDPFDGGDFTVTFAGGGNDGKYYTTGSGIRVYGNGTMTIASDKTIESITVTWDGSNKPTNVDIVDNGTYDAETGVWTGEANEIVFTRPSGSGHWRIQAIEVTYASNPGDTRIATTTSINVPETFVTDLAGSTNVSAGTLTATVMGVDGAPVSSSVNWTSSDENVATIADGAVTLLTVGTTTITATFDGDNSYKGSSKTYMLTVTDSNAKGGKNNPYTVAEAIEATPASGTSANVYIQGIVSAFFKTSITGDGSNYRYYISDDGTTTSQLLVYKGKGLNQVAFSDADDLLVGDEVVICGSLTTFSNAPEVVSGNYLVSLNRPVAAVERPVFSPEAGTYEGAQTVTITCETEGATIMYSFDKQDWQEYSNGIELSEYGTYTIYAKAVKGNDESAIVEATYTIKDSNGPGSAAQPYTVAQAVQAIIDAGNTTISDVFVKGIISKVDSYKNSKYITYWISDDGTTESQQFEVYNGLGINGAAFSSKDDLQVGDEVVVTGDITYYSRGQVYEFAQDNKLVSLSRPEAPKHAVTWEDTNDYTLFVFDMADETEPLQSGAELAEGTTVMVSPDVTKEGYELDQLLVATLDGGPVEVSVGTEAGTWTFVMPASDVVISASLKEQEVPMPTIAVEPAIVKAKAEGATGSITVTYSNVPEEWDKVLQFVEVDETTGEYPASTDEPDWMKAVLDDATGNVRYSITVNESTEARTAYACISALGGESQCYSPVITFTQGAAKPSLDGKYFVKVTSDEDVTDGYYMIVYENGNVAFNGGLETLDGASNTIEVQIDENGIPAIDETKAAVFEIAVTGTTESGKSVTICSASGKYIGRTANSNGLNASETEEYENIISIADGNALITSATNTPSLKFNKTSGQTRFRYYTSGQESIQLYKLTNEIDERTRIELAFTDGVTELQMTLGDEPVAISANATLPGTDVSNDIEYTVDPQGIYVTYENGQVTAIAAGTATITATFPGNEYYKPAAATLTVTVAEPVSTEPAIALGKTEVVLDAASGSDSFSIEAENVNGTLFQDYYMWPEPCDAEGNLQVGMELYEWVDISVQNDAEGKNVVVNANDNESAESRTAYFKIVLSIGESEYYSELITITQEGVKADPDFIIDFTQIDKENNNANPWNLPVGSSNKTANEIEYTNNTYPAPVTITVAGSTGAGYYLHTDGYLLFGKQGAYITLPAFDFAVSKIEVVGSSSASTGVKQNIFVGDVAVSTETTGAKDITNTYEIAKEYQAAGNQYTLKVTSSHNSQVTKIYIYKAETSPAIAGDMDGDGKLSANDVEMLVDYIISMQPGDFNPDADVTGNGSISIADVTSLVNKIRQNTNVSYSLIHQQIRTIDNDQTYTLDKTYEDVTSDAPAGKITVPYNGEINLNDYVKVSDGANSVLTVEELSALGYELKYELVEWSPGANGVNESYFAAIDEDGVTLRPNPQSTSVIGRQPIVKATLCDKSNNNTVVATGFVRINIGE